MISIMEIKKAIKVLKADWKKYEEEHKEKENGQSDTSDKVLQ